MRSGASETVGSVKFTAPALALAFLVLVPLGAAAQDVGEETAARDGGVEAAVDPNHDPTALPAPDYDPYADPDHPLRSEDDPGEAWNHPEARRGIGEPLIRNAEGDWDWGEVFFDAVHPSKLIVKNECQDAQVVTVTVSSLPYLEDVPERVSVPGLSEVEIPLTIRTPPQPPPPLRIYTPDEPGWGWVAPPLIPNPGDPTAPEFHQPNFVKVEGRVVLWHPWTEPCLPKRVTYNATGHIHFRPPGEEGDAGPSRIVGGELCVTWWNTGERPSLLDEDCTSAIRGLAVHYLEKIVGPLTGSDPAAWSWLPTVEEAQAMSAEELVEMKMAADAQAAGEARTATDSSAAGEARAVGTGVGGER